jgi:hypothetical protein
MSSTIRIFFSVTFTPMIGASDRWPLLLYVIATEWHVDR